MALGIPLPQIPVYPPPPLPTSTARVPTDANAFRHALYDARRESFRARAAMLGNLVLGGFTPALTVPPAANALTLSPGVCQLAIPRTGWTATDPPGAKLYVANPLTGAGTDGAYRAERHTVTMVTAAELGTGDSLVYLIYNDASADRVTVAWVLVAAAATMDWSSAVPVAWARVAGGVVTRVRDVRATPPWRRRIATVRYYTPGTPRGIPFPNGAQLLLPGTDIQSYWLRAGEAVLFTAGVHFRGVTQVPDWDNELGVSESAIRVSWANIALSKGDPTNFALGHDTWFGTYVPPPTAGTAQSSAEGKSLDKQTRALSLSVNNLAQTGNNFACAQWLFLPLAMVAANKPGHPAPTDPGQADETVPGIYHFNGLLVDSNPYRRREGTVWGAYLTAELISVARRTDVSATSAPELKRAER